MMNRIKLPLTTIIFVTLCFAPGFAQDIPTPQQYFGHVMGEEASLLDYLKSLEYYRLIANSCDRVMYDEIGKTTDGNPFVVLIISSPENLVRIDELHAARNRLADPVNTDDAEARKLAAELPAVVFHTGSIHSSEISTAQVPPEVIHRLATDNSPEVTRILDNTIILYSPSANPDGQIKYNKWYNQHKGTPWEGRMPWQYHSYVGHDNNRDWIMLHFPEQRLTATEIHQKWHPIYSLEMHEMGGSAARIFVPPYEDPLDPNTASEIVNTMNILGMAISHRLTSEGKGGVVMNAHFDLYTPARAFQVYRGTGRILTETAGGNFTRTAIIKPEDMGFRWGEPNYDPLKSSWNFPLPWQPGSWTFRDRVEYQVSANFALLNLAATHKYQLNLSQYYALKRAVEGNGWPFAYVIPTDQVDGGNTARLLRLFQIGDIRIHKADKPFEAGGHLFPADSHVIFLRQRYGAWAKTLLEAQDYPDLRRSPQEDPVVPYDVTGHTLPYLMGIQAVKIDDEFTADLSLVDQPISGRTDLPNSTPGWYAVSPESNDAYYVVDELLDEGIEVSWLNAAVIHDNRKLPAGTFVIKGSDRARGILETASRNRSFRVRGIQTIPKAGVLDTLQNPRIAIYEPWGGTMDAGWTRLVFELYELELETIRNDDIRDPRLGDRFDIIMFTGELSEERFINGSSNWPAEYSGGIGTEGVMNLNRFLEKGGTIVGWGTTSVVLSKILDLPIVDRSEQMSRREYFSPGSIVVAELESGCPVNFGMPDKAAVMIRRNPLLVPHATTGTSPSFAARFPDYDPVLSGFLLGRERIQGHGALAIQSVGDGRVVLFSYLPQFRAMTYGTFKQLFNIVYWASSGS